MTATEDQIANATVLVQSGRHVESLALLSSIPFEPGRQHFELVIHSLRQLALFDIQTITPKGVLREAIEAYHADGNERFGRLAKLPNGLVSEQELHFSARIQAAYNSWDLDLAEEIADEVLAGKLWLKANYLDDAATLFYYAGEAEVGDELMTRAIEAFAIYPETLAELARGLALLSMYRDIRRPALLSEFFDVLNEAPLTSSVAATLSWLYIERGDEDAAISLMLQSWDLEPANQAGVGIYDLKLGEDWPPAWIGREV